MGRLLKTDGTETTVIPSDGQYFSLEELQAFVGGWVEMVGLPDGRMIVCNEEGKILGLPINQVATNIWLQHYGSTDYMVGNILIADEAELER